MENIDLILEFQKKYPTKEAKEKALRKMSNKEIDALIKACPNVQGKIFYSSFKKKDESGEKKE